MTQRDERGRWTVGRRKDRPSNYPWPWIVIERKTGRPHGHFDDFTDGPYVPGYATEEKAAAKAAELNWGFS